MSRCTVSTWAWMAAISASAAATPSPRRPRARRTAGRPLGGAADAPPGDPGGAWRRSDVQEAAQADPGPDCTDDGAADQEPDADRPRVAGGHEEPLEEPLRGVELAQKVLEREHAADGEPRAHCSLHQPLGHERDPHEPVRRADELHDFDLAPTSERGEPDRVHDQEQRRRDQDRRDGYEHVAKEVRDIDELLDRLVGGYRLVDTGSRVVFVAQLGRLPH